MNFLAGEGWRDFGGKLMVGWPPLFPLLLAALGWVGIEPLEAGRLINATAFGLTILVAGLYLHSNLRSQWLVLAATATLVASLPLSHWASHFMTDPLFALFTLLALIQLAAFLNRKTDAPLWWAAGFTALAALTRYPGVALIGAGVLMLLPLARLRHTLVFGAISSLPLLAVLARNWTVSETLTGRDTKGSGQSLSEGLSQTVKVFREWVVPPNAPDGLAYLLWLAVGLVGLAGAVVALRGRRPAYFRLEPALPFAAFVLIYLVFMLAIVPLTVGQPIDSRYLLPIYVPLLVAAMFLLDRFLSIDRAEAAGQGRTAGQGRAVYGLVALVLLATLVHIGYSARESLHVTARMQAEHPPYSYRAARWQHSETLNYIRTHLSNGRIYSNHPVLAWFWDRTTAPGKHQSLPDEIHHLTSSIMYWTDGDGAYIVWLKHLSDYDYDYDDFDIRCLPGVEPVAELSDGVVFRVTAAEPFDAAGHRARKQRYVQQLIQQAGEQVVHADSTWPVSTWGAESDGEQVVRAGWNVYRNGRTLTFHKKPCAPDDVQTDFLLQVIPDDPADLQADFDNLDFNFHTHGGVRLDDQCVATAQLPDYPIGRIYIGRWISGNSRTLWDVDF